MRAQQENLVLVQAFCMKHDWSLERINDLAVLKRYENGELAVKAVDLRAPRGAVLNFLST